MLCGSIMYYKAILCKAVNFTQKAKHKTMVQKYFFHLLLRRTARGNDEIERSGHVTNREILDMMLSKGKITQQEGWDFFDKLNSCDAAELKGKWRGRELASGHSMDGLLEASGWYGKFFVDTENVYPLLFTDKNGQLFAGNPGLIPLKLAEKMPRKLVSLLFKIVSPFIKTQKSSARLRMMTIRNKTTAVMIYDQKPILDIFARVDENTLLGISDFKWEHEMGYFFVLEYTGGK